MGVCDFSEVILWQIRHKEKELEPSVLVGVSIAVTRHHDQGNSYKEKHLLGAGLHHHGGKLGSMQADTVL